MEDGSRVFISNDTEMMKKILYMAFAAVLLLTGCEKNETPKTAMELICEKWHSTDNSFLRDIYSEFTSDGKFELYQQIGEGAYRLYRGTWSMEGSVISGMYNDGNPWAASYEVIFSGKSMTWKSMNEAEERTIYGLVDEIPAEVKENCIIVVKSETSEINPLF